MFCQLINCFDVWGNKKDGYEVNDQRVECEDFYISDDSTNKDILKYLEIAGYLNTSDRRRVDVSDYGSYMEVYEKKTLKPLYCLYPKFN